MEPLPLQEAMGKFVESNYASSFCPPHPAVKFCSTLRRERYSSRMTRMQITNLLHRESINSTENIATNYCAAIIQNSKAGRYEKACESKI